MDTQIDQSFDSIGPEKAKVPSHHRAPIVANQENFLDSEMIEEADEVSNDVERRIGGGRRRHVGVAEAAEIGGYGSEALGGEKEELVAPWVPELREAVEE